MTIDERKKNAESLLKAGDHSMAAAEWKEIVEVSPLDADSWWAYGRSLRGCKKHAEAIIAYREVLRLAPAFAHGWGSLAESYYEVGKHDEAEAAALTAVKLKPDYLYPYSLVSNIRSTKKDWAGQQEILTRLFDAGHADADDLNSLAIAHANQKHHGEAIRFYRLSAKKNRAVYPYFNIGLTFESIRQPLDAIDAFERSLTIKADYEPAMQAASRLRKFLTEREESLTAAVSELPRADWYSNYINPFQLFGAERGNQEYFYDTRRYTVLKKRLQHNLLLDDGRAGTLEDHVVESSAVEDAHKDILDPELRTFHWNVFSQEPLLDFLSKGSLNLFRLKSGGSSIQIIEMLEQAPAFQAWLSPIFARQFNASLAHFMKCDEVAALEALLSGRRWTLPEDDDVAFERMQRLVADWLSPLHELRKSSGEILPRRDEIGSVIFGGTSEGERLRLLRSLPLQFREQINQAAAAVRSIAIDCYNKHKQTVLARDIIHMAKLIPQIDTRLEEQLKEDLAAIEKILKDESDSEFESLISQGKVLRITKHGVEYDHLKLAPQDVRSLAWGIYVHRVNGIETHRNYSISIGGVGQNIQVEWDSTGLIVGLVKKVLRDKQATIPVRDKPVSEQDLYFQAIVGVLLKAIVPSLIEYLTSLFNSGATIPVGEAKFSKHGVSFRTGIVFKDDHSIPWAQLDTLSQNGEVILFSKSKRSAEIRFNAKTTPNAVMLPVLCHLLK